MPTTKQMYRLRKVRLRANSLEACRIQLSDNQDISSATAKKSAIANITVATRSVLHKPTVL